MRNWFAARRALGVWGAIGVSGLLSILSISASAADSNDAMNAGDRVAWTVFLQATQPAAGGKPAFETWASDSDTFKPYPIFPAPGTAVPPKLHPPVIPTAGLTELQRCGQLMHAVPPNPDIGEEARRNRAAFDFIVQNQLYSIKGLRAAYGKTLSFPIDAIEIKANWTAVGNIPSLTRNKVSAADVARVFFVDTGSNGKQYALLSMHVITKLVPNWTWATFEHRLNPGRCDILGCRDNYGASPSSVPPSSVGGGVYADCTKTAALSAAMSAAGVDPVFSNYCLKGSQTVFTNSTGLYTRLGNSVTEAGFVDRSSCLTCHGHAAFDDKGLATSGAGFENGVAPLGPIKSGWYWTSAKPEPTVGDATLIRVATGSDFVWSIPFCAFDDTVTPPRPSGCLGR